MSVTHPLIKELKGHVSWLLCTSMPLNDFTEEVVLFCECLERILLKGLLPKTNAVLQKKDGDPWTWVRKFATEKLGAPYSYVSCVNNVNKCVKVSTNVGRLRLFIRTALMNKCIHTPIKMLVVLKKQMFYYSPESILGDEILTELLLSILLTCCKLRFELNLKVSRFLDETWNIPEGRDITVVPCDELGMSIMFVGRIPTIVSIIPNSVADDVGGINVGDILDEVNGKTITLADQGNLFSLLNVKSGLNCIHIIKSARMGAVFPPLIRVLREAGLEPSSVAFSSLPPQEITQSDEVEKCVDFMGEEPTGMRSDMRQINLAVNRFLGRSGGVSRSVVQAVFSFHDLGIKVKYYNPQQGDILFEHSFLEISCCGSTSSIPQYFAYIAGNKDYLNAKEFTCYIFHSTNQSMVDKILRSIAQGFKRTLCAV